MVRLSCILLEYGYFSALGTTERDGDLVGRGTPLTFDSNNGVFVVYDEEGRPWIKRVNEVTGEMREELQECGAKRGCYVPHSNDGGYFIHEVVGRL